MRSRGFNLYSPLGQRASKALLFSILVGFAQMVFALAPFMDTPAQAATSNFSYSTSIQYFTVPESVYSLTITLTGGSGGFGGADGQTGGTVGYIGKVTGTISVRPGDTITIAIGGGGVNGQTGVNTIGSGSQGGWNPIAAAAGNSAYNGATGGVAGPTGTSGDGGGGGAATVVHISGHGYYIAAGGGGSGGGNNVSKIDGTVQASYPNGISGENRTQTSNGTLLYGRNPATPGSGIDGGGSGGGGGGFAGGTATDPQKISNSSEVYGYGASAGSNAISNSGDTGVTASFVSSTSASSGCHYGSGNTAVSTGWSNYGCGADGSVSIVYAPTPTLSQTDQNNASVQSTEVGTVYLVNETVSVSSLTDITNAPSNLKTSVAITTANSPTNISLSGLSPGTYVAYAYSSASSSLSSASRTTVAAGGMCTFTTASGLVFSNAYRLGYCFVTFTSGSGSWTVPSGVTNVSLLAVGGGGGGGENGASGGGGGALQDISNYRVTSGGTVSVAVGAGGIGGSTSGSSSAAGSSGSVSSFGTVSANGGGGGNTTGGSGGVGGVGGSGGTSSGGVGGAGARSVGATPSAAGNGASSLILGLSNYYAGGGAGGDWQYGIGTAGTGGGWSGIELQQGATYNNALANAGGNGLPNTGGGGGGGGGGATYGYGGSGGSGVVVVRYIATSFKQTGPGDTTMYVGDSATLTTTAPNLFSGITRTIKWQVSFDTGTTWTNVDSGTIGITSSYQTPIETNTTLTYWFRAAITDTTTSYSFATYTDTGTLIFLLRPSNDTDTALYFNGSQVMKTRSVVYNDSAGGSIEVWVKPAVGSCAAASNQTVIYKANTFQIYCRSGLWYGFTSTGTNAAGTISFSGMPVRTGEWTHLAITFDGTKLVGYYNGQATEIQTVNNASANVPTPWLVGGTGSANEYFTGQIDDLKIWNNYVVETQVAIDMDTYTSSNAAGLTAHYDFNEGSGNGVYNRDYPYDSGATDLFPYVGSATYSWNAIESSSVSGNYKTVQIPRTILTASGGWKIPTQVNTSQTFLVSGGGGGGENAGQGGAGGGALKGIAATRSTNNVLRVKVGVGGNGGLPSGNNLFYASLNYGQTGLSTILATPDLTTNGLVTGGSRGLNYSTDVPCSSGGTPLTTGAQGGSTQFSTGFTNTTPITGGAGGIPPQSSGSNGQAGGAGFANSLFNGIHLFGGGGGSGGWSGGSVGGSGGGDGGSAKGGNGTPSATAGESANANTGNGGGGAGNTACTAPGGNGGSGVVYLKYLTLDTVTVTGPNNDTTTAGSKYTFKISATTPNAALTRSYQWQFSSDSGTTWTNLTTGVGYDSNTYTTATLDNTTSGSQFQYHCLVIDSDTNGISIFATSNNAYLTMNGAPTISGAATITTTYGTPTSSSYTPLLGTPTRTFTMLPGTYGGVLDPSFNGLGYETSTFTQGNSYANAVAFSPDGGVIVGGQTYSGYDNFSLVKYKSSGAIDTSFGTNGFVLTNMGISSVITALTIDSSTGKITAVGQAAGVGGNDGRIGVARYLASGLLDTTFAAIGYETITIPNSSNTGNYVSGVAVQSDGKIFISASRLNSSGTTDSATILRLTTTGSLDSGFGSGGYAEFAWGAGYNYSVDIALQSDGKILLAGREQDTNSNGRAQFAATRLNANGTIDATFGTSGTTIFPAPCSGYCLTEINAQIASDNSIYFIGTTNASPYNVYTAHLNAGGSRDSLWGGSGFTTETVTAGCHSPSIAINSAQQIAASCSYNSTNFYTPIYLYDSAGARVPTFGSAGVALINMPVSTGLSPQSQLSGRPANQFFNIDASNNYYLVGMQGNNYAVMKIAGNNISATMQSTSITLDTKTLEVGKIVVDTFTPAGTYLQTLVVTDSSSVSGYKTVTITVNKAPGVTITASPASGAYAYVGDTATFFETVTASGLIAGDTVSVTFSAKAPSSNTLTAVKVVGDTYTIAPVTADTFTITPSITSISHGSVSNGQLSNYLSTTYVAGLMRINRSTRTGFAINSSSGFAYAYVGAPLQLSVMNTRDTGTVSFTVSGANCVLDTTTLLLSDTATSNATCIVTATIARTTNWETATAQTTFYFQAYVNYYPSPADGTGPTIALSGQVAITIVAGAPTITGALVYSYDSTAAVVFTITGTGFGSLASAVQVKIGRKLGTITAISDTSITVNFSVPTYGDNVNWGRLSVATPVAVASIPTEYISGQPWRYSTQVNI
jgi:uncharacterized delta-60 repeat protein